MNLTIIYLTREPIASAHLAAGKISVIRNSALVYQTGALFFVSKNRNNKGYDCTKHNYKREQVRVCNHITSSFQCVRQLV